MTFKLGLLSFWSLWHGIVLLTNLCEGLKVAARVASTMDVCFEEL